MRKIVDDATPVIINEVVDMVKGDYILSKKLISHLIAPSWTNHEEKQTKRKGKGV